MPSDELEVLSGISSLKIKYFRGGDSNPRPGTPWAAGLTTQPWLVFSYITISICYEAGSRELMVVIVVVGRIKLKLYLRS